MDNKVLLSVVIPTYKRDEYLYSAINSVINQKNSCCNFEILVVSNDPNVSLKKYLQKYSDVPNIHFFKNETNLGMLGNMNKCVELAKGEYIAFLHDDDLLLSNYLETIVPLLKSNRYSCIIPERYVYYQEKREVNIIKTFKRTFKEKLTVFTAKVIKPSTKVTYIKTIDNMFSWQNCYCAPSCGTVFKRNKMIENGIFCGGEYAWDFTSFIKFNENETIVILHETLGAYRLSISASLKAEVQYDFYNTREKLIDYFGGKKECRKFINIFKNEIQYLNYKSVTSNCRDMIQKNMVDIKKTPSKWLKYFLFEIMRLFYYITHNLLVERVPSGRKYKEICSIDRIA